MASLMDQIPASNRDAFIRALLAGSYNLLLGAGASLDSTDSASRHLPLASGLTDEINEVCGTHQQNLADAYDLALENDSNRLTNYLQQRFLGCIPAAWWLDISKCIWRRIWTLNIDDVVEQVYADPRHDGPRLAAVYNWDDGLKEDHGMQLVHLHGRVAPRHRARLVFSIAEYVETIERKHAWYRKFFDDWVGQPFITIGSSLFGEYDLAQATRSKRPVGQEPSLYVSHRIGQELHEQLGLRNLIPVEMLASQLALEVQDLTREHRQTTYYQWQSTGASPADIATFSDQFELLDLSDSKVPVGHDFFKGNPPRWGDVTSGRSAVLSWHERIAKIIQADVKSTTPSQRVHVLFGERFSGRSIGILTVAKLMSQAGYSCFQFRSLRRVNVRATINVLMGRGRSVLFFDGIGDFTSDVDALLSEAKRTGLHLIIVAAERNRRRHIVFADIADASVVVHDKGSNFAWDPPNGEDSLRLVDHVETRGRYALLQPMSRSERIAFFSSRLVFDAMSELEYGTGFRERLAPEIATLPNVEARLLVLLVAFLNRLGYGFPLGFVNVTGLSAAETSTKRFRRTFSELLIIEDAKIFARFRDLSIATVKAEIATEQVFEAVLRFLVHLAPYLNKETRRGKSVETRLIKAAMRARSLKSILGTLQLQPLYERLAQYFGSDARFWEQRSIASQFVNKLDAATSYAARAVDLAPRDSWRRTTLGRLFLLRSYKDAAPGSPDSWDFYHRGQAELEQAVALQPTNGLAILIQLRHSIELYRSLLLVGVEEDDYLAIETYIPQTIRLARYHPSLVHTQEQSLVAKLISAFFSLKVVRNGSVSDTETKEILARKFPKLDEDPD